MPPIVLIGPMCAGKSTIAALLATRLGRPRVELDEYRWAYYAEAGYDEDEVRRIHEGEGMAGILRYWKPFEVDAVERVVVEHPTAIIDFGAGHSVHTDEALFARVREALAPIPAVILLLPTPDEAETITILNTRLTELLERDVGEADPDVLAVNAQFVRHPSNERLAKAIFYTAGHTPEQTTDAIIKWLDSQAHYK